MDQPALSPEVLPLPKGGGSARSIGDTFSPDLHTGTGSYRIPLWFPRGPGRFQPALALVYSSGAGIGMFGMGWQLPLTRIIRRTDRGVPRYDESDTLLLDGEEIVPVGGVYRQLREQTFRRVERSGDGWIVREKDGRRAELGTTAAGRIETTDGGVTRTYAWLVERVVDPNGNEIRYAYTSDGPQRYLQSISYGLYRVTFAYEDRPDPFTLTRAGFELPVTKRGIRIDYRLVGAADPLFRRYTIGYAEAPLTRISLLASVTLTGHRRRQSVPTSVAAPTLRFRYATFQPGHRLRAFRPARNAPPPLLGLDDGTVDLVDLEGTGRPGVAQLGEAFQRYWPNRGDGRWAAPRSLRTLPAGAALDNPAVAFADMDGDFTPDLLDLTRRPLSYYRNEPGVGLDGRTRFRRSPSFAPDDPDVRLLDLDQDGVVDALRTGEQQFYAYYNRGPRGWDPPVAIRRVHDPRLFPDVFFSDPRVTLASMTGEGLADIVLVHGGRVDYWPNLGHGRFGARVTLGVSPPLGRKFDARRLFLIDVDGDGRADVVYVDLDRVHLWLNRGGRELVPAGLIRHTPRTTGDNVRPADMLGRGSTGLVWSSPARSSRDRNYRFLDLTGPSRPYLMSSVEDGTGLVIDVEYEPSPAHEQRAREQGSPWQTALPFPVQTITRIRRRDTMSGTRAEQAFRYRDGWADGRTREFRGFRRVETLEEGDAESPATRTVTHFLQGRPDENPGMAAEARGTLAGRFARIEVFGPDGSADAALPLRVEDNVYDVRTIATAADGRQIRFPFLVSSTVRTSDDRRAPPLIDSSSLVYDDYGNVRERRERWDSGSGTQEVVTTIRCTADVQRWILDLAVEVVQRDGQGTLLGCTRMYYDGPDFEGLPLGQVTRGNLSRREQLVLTDAMVAGFGTPAPGLPALGYHRMSVPGGESGWGADTARERFDARGNSIGRRDALGNTGRIEYEPSGTYPIAVFDPLGRSHGVEYDSRAGEIALLAEPNGHRTRYRFDQLGRLEAMIKPGDSAARPTMGFEYLDAALPLGVTVRLRADPGAASTQDEVEYVDGSGRPLQRRSAAEGGRVIVDGWRRDNRRGWEAERTPPFFSTGFAYVAGEGSAGPHRYRFRYDALGRIVETVTPDGRPSRMVRGRGLIRRYDVSDTDDSPANVARGHFDTPREERFDARGRLLSITEQARRGSLLTTRFGRDALGRVLNITDTRNVRTAEYRYDLLGRVIRALHVDAGERRALYDARGQPALLIDAAGRRLRASHDALGRLREVRAGSVVTESYDYDTGPGENLIGRLARVRDEAGEVRFSYTPRGLVERKTRVVETLAGQRSFELAYEYDSMERMRRIDYPDGSRVDYAYNARGLMERIAGIVDGIDYNPVRQPVEVRYANGVTERAVYGAGTFFLETATVRGPARPQPYYDVRYDHDAIGNPLAVTDRVSAPGHRRFNRTFEYDALYRLTGASGTLDGVAFARSYRYDDAGNFTRNDELSSADVYLDPAASNRVRGTESGGVRTPLFGYDANGNVVQAPGLPQLTFDVRSRLQTVRKTDGTEVEYRYGYDGQRVRKRVRDPGGTRETLYLDSLFEVRGGQQIRHVFNGELRVASQPSSGARVYYHRDHLRNTVLVTSAAGAIVQELGYMPYGGAAFASPSGAAVGPYGFLGNELDGESGLIFCHSRYYHPGLGRFISPDLLVVMDPEKALGSPTGMNPYAYAVDNPVRLIDADGTQFGWLLGGLLIVGLVIATVAVGIATGGAGFAFGILLAASIGSAIGAGIGAYSASRRGGSIEAGFAFGAVMGAVAGAAGYAFGTHIAAGAYFSSGAASVIGGAVQGAIIGAGNGAIIGFAGGVGTPLEILQQAAIGAAVGAVLGGVSGYLRWKGAGEPADIFGQEARSTFAKPLKALFEAKDLGGMAGAALQAAGNVASKLLGPQALTWLSAYAPTALAELGAVAHIGIREHRDFLTSLCPKGECILPLEGDL